MFLRFAIMQVPVPFGCGVELGVLCLFPQVPPWTHELFESAEVLTLKVAEGGVGLFERMGFQRFLLVLPQSAFN